MDPNKYDNGKEWSNGLFGCFGDCSLCIITFFIPCYTIGKNTEALDGDGCLMAAIMSCLGFPYNPVLHWRTRVAKKIKGSMMEDLVISTCCGFCTAIQDARELGWHKADSKVSDIVKDIERT